MSTIFFKVKDRETGEVISDEARYENGVITSDHWMKPGVKTLMYWDNANEPDEWVSEMSGRDAVLVATSEVNDRGEVVRRFDESGYDSEGRDWQGFNASGWDKDGYDREGYDKNGFDFYGYHRDTGTDLDEDGYDSAGYDTSGRDRDGYDRNGYDRDGYRMDEEDGILRDREGYDEDGYDKRGYDRNGRDVDGWTEDGYRRDENGVERDAGGYDRAGYDEDGYDIEGYDFDGYDADGYDERGYDADGYDRDGFDERGYDRSGNSEDDIIEAMSSGDESTQPKGRGFLGRVSDFMGGGFGSQRPSNPFGGDATVSGGKGHEGKPMVDGYEYVNKNGKRVHVDSYKNPRYKGPRR